MKLYGVESTVGFDRLSAALCRFSSCWCSRARGMGFFSALPNQKTTCLSRKGRGISTGVRFSAANRRASARRGSIARSPP